MVSLPARRRLSVWRRSPAGRLASARAFSSSSLRRGAGRGAVDLAGAGLALVFCSASCCSRASLSASAASASRRFFSSSRCAASSARRAASISACLASSTARTLAPATAARRFSCSAADRLDASAGAAAGLGALSALAGALVAASAASGLPPGASAAPGLTMRRRRVSTCTDLLRPCEKLWRTCPPSTVRFRLSVLPRGAFDLASSPSFVSLISLHSCLRPVSARGLLSDRQQADAPHSRHDAPNPDG